MASVLLSEADPNVRRLLMALLEQLGHEAIVLDGGLDVPPPADFLLLDPTAPAYLEQARIARQRDPALRIVWMSMLPPDARFVKLGPNTHLAKPFALEGLHAALEAALASPAEGSSS
jgi:CheY-like chemotaxis protein